MKSSKPVIAAAIYARYSTEKQDERSTEDQIRRCKRFAEANGLSVVGIYEDKAQSGASAARADLQRLLADARAKGGSPFGAVLVDDQSRLARDLGTAWRLIFEELPPLGVKVVDCTTGRASDETGARLTFGVTALMNDAFLEMVRAETHRGMEGRALTGFATGGRTFGYSTRKEANPSDPEHARSEMFINDAEAELVRRIFAQWIEGYSFKAIAIQLNDEGVRAPHDGGNGHKGNRGWVPTTIRAMLMNERYLGKIVWNKSKWIKDRQTGKRRQVSNPPEAWVTIDRPDLQIVDRTTFEAAQLRFRQRPSGAGRPAGTFTKRMSLCAGLLRCGACAGSMTIVGQRKKGNETYRQFGCTTHATRGASVCSNNKTISEKKAAEGVVREVRKLLERPGIADELATLFATKMAAVTKTDVAERLAKEISQAEKKIRNLFDAVGKLGLSDSLAESIREAEERLKALRARKVEGSGAKVLAHPAKVQHAIRNILETLEKDSLKARELLKKHIGALVLTPTEDGYAFDGGFLLGLTPESETPAEAVGASAGVSVNRGSGGRMCRTFNAPTIEEFALVVK